MLNHLDELCKDIFNSNRLAIARAMTIIENEKDGYTQLLSSLYRFIGKAFRIGITGPPGAGKSTLTNFLAKLLIDEGNRVGIIAVDPTSPFTGGAILGDRVRMNNLALNQNGFIRSMATRGSMGGLARQATECADVLDAAGFDYIFYETVGVGQVELDIAQAADTTIVMIVPESGDVIQNLKAGLMEIGDIFVLNKADRPDAERMMRDLKYVLHLKAPTENWSPNVLQTIAHKGEGISELRYELKNHRDYLESNDQLKRIREIRLRKRVETIVRQKLEHHFWSEKRKKLLEDYLENKKEHLSPYELAEQMLEKMSSSL